MMKKCLILLALLAASMAPALTVKWTTSVKVAEVFAAGDIESIASVLYIYSGEPAAGPGAEGTTFYTPTLDAIKTATPDSNVVAAIPVTTEYAYISETGKINLTATASSTIDTPDSSYRYIFTVMVDTTTETTDNYFGASIVYSGSYDAGTDTVTLSVLPGETYDLAQYVTIESNQAKIYGVPEPTTLALLALGLAGLALKRRA